MAKTALITGITGQDGAYLARLLLEKGYRVHGGARRTSQATPTRLEELGIADDITLHELEMSELTNIRRVLDAVAPDEVYNLAAQSFVASSFRQPLYTTNIDGLGALRLLECLRESKSNARFYQASSSEMFGMVRETPQRETTPFYPRSPYGIAKLFAHWSAVNYRESYGMFAVSGILFNHESPLRGKEFLTRKITDGLARIRNGVLDHVALGNLDVTRDWGYAGDYVQGMWLMMQQETPDDFVLATGVSTSVRTFAERAAEAMGMSLQWQGAGLDEVGVDTISGKIVIRIDPAHRRPAEVSTLLGDPGKAEAVLGWRRTMDLKGLVHAMAEADDRRIRDAGRLRSPPMDA